MKGGHRPGRPGVRRQRFDPSLTITWLSFRLVNAVGLVALAWDEGDLLYVFAKDEETAAEMEDPFALHISIIATDILKHEIGIVLVLPKQLAR
jgi:hypothetical protein